MTGAQLLICLLLPLLTLSNECVAPSLRLLSPSLSSGSSLLASSITFVYELSGVRQLCGELREHQDLYVCVSFDDVIVQCSAIHNNDDDDNNNNGKNNDNERGLREEDDDDDEDEEVPMKSKIASSGPQNTGQSKKLLMETEKLEKGT